MTSAAKSSAKAKKTVPIITEAAHVEAPEASLVSTVKKKEFIERVAEASGVKRSEAKKAIEATLKELGDALQRGEDLNLPPLGKMSVNRQQEKSGAQVIIAKLRRPKAMLENEGATEKTASGDPEES